MLSRTRETGTRILSQKAICPVDGIAAPSMKRLASDAKKPAESSIKQARRRQRGGVTAVRLRHRSGGDARSGPQTPRTKNGGGVPVPRGFLPTRGYRRHQSAP